MTIEIRGLGLAGYLRIHPDEAKFVKYERGKYIFESEQDESYWRVRYLNSCCYRHDSEVMALRIFKQQDRED